MEVVIRTHSAGTPIIVNCQLGKRRSTIAAVCDFSIDLVFFILTHRGLFT
jgi:hypothetical protein